MTAIIANQAELSINVASLQKAAKIYRALNHKLRNKMIQYIHSKGRTTVTDIYVELKMEQSVASAHLALLRSAGVVLTERDGRFIFYSLNYQRIRQIQVNATDLIRNQ